MPARSDLTVTDAHVLREADALQQEGADVHILAHSPNGLDHGVMLPSGVVLRQFATVGSRSAASVAQMVALPTQARMCSVRVRYGLFDMCPVLRPRSVSR